jgi:hypothetical protein
VKPSLKRKNEERNIVSWLLKGKRRLNADNREGRDQMTKSPPASHFTITNNCQTEDQLLVRIILSTFETGFLFSLSGMFYTKKAQETPNIHLVITA